VQLIYAKKKDHGAVSNCINNKKFKNKTVVVYDYP
jgi:hypothetical protein